MNTPDQLTKKAKEIALSFLYAENVQDMSFDQWASTPSAKLLIASLAGDGLKWVKASQRLPIAPKKYYHLRFNGRADEWSKAFWLEDNLFYHEEDKKDRIDSFVNVEWLDESQSLSVAGAVRSEKEIRVSLAEMERMEGRAKEALNNPKVVAVPFLVEKFKIWEEASRARASILKWVLKMPYLDEPTPETEIIATPPGE